MYYWARSYNIDGETLTSDAPTPIEISYITGEGEGHSCYVDIIGDNHTIECTHGVNNVLFTSTGEPYALIISPCICPV